MEENNKLIRKKIIENLLVVIAVMIYFIIINFLYLKFDEDMVLKGIKLVSLIVLFLCIEIFEMAYHKDSGKITIYGIEILILAFHTLTIYNVINKVNITFGKYLVYSSYAFSIYYFFKVVLIYTNERRKYLKSLSDIHEIVSNEPTKKEAKKRKNKENT